MKLLGTAGMQKTATQLFQNAQKTARAAGAKDADLTELSTERLLLKHLFRANLSMAKADSERQENLIDLFG